MATPSARRHDTAALGFSHAVIVDQQRPGFEPDVKVAPNGSIFTSIPFGFSTTQSFLWSSRDNGNSYQFVPGTVGPGKPATCVGGGDTDLFIDPGNALYFSDLQGLTNISNSMSTDGGATFTTNCAGAPNAPDDRMWFTGTGSSAGANLNLYQDYDAVDGALPNGGQSAGGDGLARRHHLHPGHQHQRGRHRLCRHAARMTASPTTRASPATRSSIRAPATSSSPTRRPTRPASRSPRARSPRARRPRRPGPRARTSTRLCAPTPTCTDAAGNPEELAGENFASIARDSAGYLYVTFTAGSLDHASSSDANFGALTAPEQIYVVHSLQPAGADPSTLTWSAPQKITGSGASAGTNTFPWITAGSDGRVDVAWYHAPADLGERAPAPAGRARARCTAPRT